MKKILVIILVLCTFTCCLASCNKNEDTVIYEKNTWFTAEALELYMLEDLPEISEVEYIRGSKTVFAKMSDEQLDNYANEVFEYLKGQEFKHLGFRNTKLFSVIAQMLFYVIAIKSRQPNSNIKCFNIIMLLKTFLDRQNVTVKHSDIATAFIHQGYNIMVAFL